MLLIKKKNTYQAKEVRGRCVICEHLPGIKAKLQQWNISGAMQSVAARCAQLGETFAGQFCRAADALRVSRRSIVVHGIV